MTKILDPIPTKKLLRGLLIVNAIPNRTIKIFENGKAVLKYRSTNHFLYSLPLFFNLIIKKLYNILKMENILYIIKNLKKRYLYF